MFQIFFDDDDDHPKPVRTPVMMMDEIANQARLARKSLDEEEWHLFRTNILLSPENAGLVHSCPLTRRAYEKPRGYPGDAVILDHMYASRHPEAPEPEQGTLSRQIFDYVMNGSAIRAVRYRRSLLAHFADEVAHQFAEPRFLSIAASHLREIEQSAAFKAGKVREWVAVDQDAESLKTIASDYPGIAVLPVLASVRDILKGGPDIGKFHYTYAAGLFDYLDDPTARALLQRMADLTESGGCILIANFLPSTPDIGFMESFMDWRLIYRTEAELRAPFDGTPGVSAQVVIHTDPEKNIAFAIARKT